MVGPVKYPFFWIGEVSFSCRCRRDCRGQIVLLPTERFEAEKPESAKEDAENGES